MSYAVVHMQKFSKDAVRGIQSHNQREKESHTNPDIDYARSSLNYDLLNRERVNYHREINTRIESLADTSKAIRKDAIRMCSFIITSDHDYFENLTLGQQKSFFSDSLIFFQDRYGADRIVNATVHMDERTPHMHLGFVPIGSNGRLSAKNIFNAKELRSLQTDFVKVVGKQYGLERGKEGSEAEHITPLRHKVALALQEASSASLEAQTQTTLTDVLSREISALEAKLDALKGTFQVMADIPSGKKGLLGNVSFTKSEAADLIKTAEAYWFMSSKASSAVQKAKEAEQRADQAEHSAGGQENKKLQQENNNIKTENRALRYANSKLDEKIKKHENILSKYPDMAEAYLQAEKEIKRKLSRGYERG